MFKLDFDIPKSNEQLTLRSKIYLIGSCFSDEIVSRLLQFKFDVLSNPFGTIYNPISIFKLLTGKIDEHLTTTYQDVHYHWDCHGETSALSLLELKQEVSKRKTQSAEFLSAADWIIITLGTAFVYRLKSSNEVVANCHRAPSQDFSKELLSCQEITKAFQSLNQTYLNGKKVLLTVSPVRHIRDGLIQNNQSKSVLIQSVQEIVHSNENVSYFPSYEIVMDELRDYRFFEKDFIHPTDEAIDYVWERFITTFMDDATLTFIKEWAQMRQAIHHRPFQPTSQAHQKFLKETISKLDRFKEVVDISEEQKLLEQQLI